MCFMLYAGTAKPIPCDGGMHRSSELPVSPPEESGSLIKAYFSTPEVQRIGSTSGCGCEFPHLLFRNGEWAKPEDAEWDDRETRSMEMLIALLQTTREAVIELCGIYLGGGEDSADAPRFHKDVTLDRLLDGSFHFKEDGLYRVSLPTQAD